MVALRNKDYDSEPIEGNPLVAFMGASRKAMKDGVYMSEEERADWEERMIKSGVQNFKRRILGLCGREAYKTLDELARTLYDVGAVPGIEEGRELVPQLAKIRWIEYGARDGGKLIIREAKTLTRKSIYLVHAAVPLTVVAFFPDTLQDIARRRTETL